MTPSCSRAPRSRRGTGGRCSGLPLHTLVRGRFVMRDRALVADTRGFGRSVHSFQHLPAAAPRNTDQTMRAIVGGAGARSEQAA